MKNARIGLLLLSVFIFQTLESKPQQKQQPKAKPTPQHRAVKPSKARAQESSEVVQPIKEERKVSQAELTDDNNENFVDTEVIRNRENNTVTEVTKTVTVDQENNKVITEEKSSTWTAIDYAKAGAIAAGVIGLGVVAGYNFSPTFAGQVDGAGLHAKEYGKSAYNKAGELKNSFNNWRNPSVAPVSEKMQQEVIANIADQRADTNTAAAMPMENVGAPQADQAPVNPEVQKEVIANVADAAVDNLEQLKASGAPAEQVAQAEKVADITAEIQEKVESGVWSLDRAKAEFNKLEAEYPNAVLAAEVAGGLSLAAVAIRSTKGQAVWNAIKNAGNKMRNKGATAGEEGLMSEDGNLLKDLATQNAALGGEKAAVVKPSKFWATPQGSLINNATTNHAQQEAFAKAEATIAAQAEAQAAAAQAAAQAEAQAAAAAQAKATRAARQAQQAAHKEATITGQSARDFKGDNYPNDVKPTINQGLHKLSQTQADIAKSQQAYFDEILANANKASYG